MRDITCVVLCSIVIIVLSKPRPHTPSRTVFVGLPGEFIEHMVLGFRLPAADLLWLRVIQDFGTTQPGITDYSWNFHIMDAATRLDPRFRMIYVMGAPMLSYINDKQGAKIIFDRGMQNLPHDWTISYRAGYHYLYELHDCHDAARIFNESLADGAPIFLSSLVGRLYSTAGQYDLAREVITEQLKASQENPRSVAVLKQRLKEIDEEDSKHLTGGIMKDCIDAKAGGTPANKHHALSKKTEG